MNDKQFNPLSNSIPPSVEWQPKRSNEWHLSVLINITPGEILHNFTDGFLLLVFWFFLSMRRESCFGEWIERNSGINDHATLLHPLICQVSPNLFLAYTQKKLFNFNYANSREAEDHILLSSLEKGLCCWRIQKNPSWKIYKKWSWIDFSDHMFEVKKKWSVHDMSWVLKELTAPQK